MGLLGNVAEVEELRPQLMTSEFITVFSDLLYSTSDGIEVRLVVNGKINLAITFNCLQVSYNAAGVLAHIASDGAECWKIKEPKREDVLNRIVTAIDRWDLDSKRNINYR